MSPPLKVSEVLDLSHTPQGRSIQSPGTLAYRRLCQAQEPITESQKCNVVATRKSLLLLLYYNLTS